MSQRIKVNSIYTEGFRSIAGPYVFNFADKGLYLVKGENGVGKTTLFEALVWGIFGENLKDTVNNKVAPWAEIRKLLGEAFKGTKVEVNMTIDGSPVVIARHLKYIALQDKLLVTVGNKEQAFADKKEAQEYINSLLGMDFRLFSNSFLFGQRMSRMISASNSEKRKILEEMFDMDWINLVWEDVKKDLAEQQEIMIKAEMELSTQETLYEDSCTRLEEAKDNLKEVEAQIKEDEANYKKQISEKEEDINSLVEDIRIYNEELDQIQTEAPPEVSDIEKQIADINESINNNQDRIGKLKEGIEINDRVILRFNLDEIRKDENLIKERSIALKKLFAEHKLEETDFDNDIIEATKAGYEELISEADTQDQELSYAKKKIEELKESLKNYSGVCSKCGQELPDKDSYIAHVNEDIKKNEAIALDLEKAIGSLDNQIDEHIFNVYGAILEIKRQIEEAEQRIPEGYQDQIDAINLDTDTRQLDIEAAEEERLALINKKGAKEKELTELGPKIEEYRKSMTQKANIQGLIVSKEAKLQEERNTLADINAELKALPTRVESYKKQVLSIQEKIKEYELVVKERAAEYDKQKLKVDAINWWSSKVFAANGLRAYVFKAMLERLNSYTEKYGSRLGVSMRFTLNLDKASAPFDVICSVGDRINKDYKEFSGGQQQRLDIVLMFAMHDLLSEGNSLSILVLDEALDGLDISGESAVFDLIKTKAEEQAVYVITHVQNLDTLHTKTITVTADNGITTIHDGK